VVLQLWPEMVLLHRIQKCMMDVVLILRLVPVYPLLPGSCHYLNERDISTYIRVFVFHLATIYYMYKNFKWLFFIICLVVSPRGLLNHGGGGGATNACSGSPPGEHVSQCAAIGSSLLKDERTRDRETSGKRRGRNLASGGRMNCGGRTFGGRRTGDRARSSRERTSGERTSSERASGGRTRS